jgi:hypothetical protein
MATVSNTLPGRASANPAAGGPAGESPLSAGVVGAGGIGTAVIGRADVGSPAGVARRASLSPLVVVAHGLLAISTMALVLLAALGTAAL